MPKEIKDTEIKEDEIKDEVNEEVKPKEDTPNQEPKVIEKEVIKEVEVENTEGLEELQRRLDEAMEFKTKYEEAVKYKEQYEETQEALKGHEQTLEQIAQERIESIPEDYRDLVPNGTTQEKLQWLSKAEKSGLFKAKEVKSIGSSSRVNDKEAERENTKDLTPIQKLTSGFTDFYMGK